MVLFIFKDFIYESESKHGREGGGREEETDSLLAGSSMCSLIPGPWDYDLSFRLHLTDWTTQAPLELIMLLKQKRDYGTTWNNVIQEISQGEIG